MSDRAPPIHRGVGCGPVFATLGLSELVGPTARVVAVVD